MSRIQLLGGSERQRTQFRIERLVAMLNQANQLLIGLGQYVPDNDSNRTVMIEVIASNAEVLNQEVDALHEEDKRIITRIS